MSRHPVNPGPVLRLVHADGEPPQPKANPAKPHGDRPASPAMLAARRAIAAENRLAAGLSTHDARWTLAVDVAAAMVGGTAAILPVQARERLVAKGQKLGLRPFDANLVIAVVQDAQREGRALSRDAQERLTMVRPADPALVADPGKKFVAALILAAVLLLAFGIVTSALR